MSEGNGLPSKNPLRSGIIGLTVVVCLVLVSFGFSGLPFVSRGIGYDAYFTDASGITPGADVTVSGITVGSVEDVELAPGAAKVSFTVRRDLTVGDQTLASIRSDTVLGDRSLALKLAGGRPIRSIPLAQTSTPYTLSSALQDLGSGTAALDDKQFTTALGVLTDALREATPQLSGALHNVTDLAQVVNDNDKAVADLLGHANKVTAVLAARAKEVNQIIVDGSILLGALDERRDAIGRLIQGIEPVAKQLSGLVDDNRKEFGPALEKLNLVLDNLLQRKDKISSALKLLPMYSLELGEVVSTGPAFNVNLYGQPPPAISSMMLDAYFQPGKLPDSLADYLRGFINDRAIVRPKSP